MPHVPASGGGTEMTPPLKGSISKTKNEEKKMKPEFCTATPKITGTRPDADRARVLSSYAEVLAHSVTVIGGGSPGGTQAHS